jgi:hypothetical protein
MAAGTRRGSPIYLTQAALICEPGMGWKGWAGKVFLTSPAWRDKMKCKVLFRYIQDRCPGREVD